MTIELFRATGCQGICNCCEKQIPLDGPAPSMVQIFIGLADNEGYVIPPTSVHPSQFILCRECCVMLKVPEGTVSVQSLMWYNNNHKMFEGTLSTDDLIDRLKTEAAKIIVKRAQQNASRGGPHA